jgi:MFS family permease
MVLLRNRGFVLLWAGQLASLLADWAVRTLLLIWVYKLTRSGVAVSIVGIAEAFPLLVLAPVAGVFVDRWHRARTMTCAVLARLMLLLPLLAVHTGAGLPVIVLVTLLANSATQFFLPAAAAALPVVVGPDEIGPANNLLSFVNSVVTMAGPAVAGLLFALAGPQRAVVLLGLLYLAAAPCLLAVPAPRAAEAGTSGAALLAEMAHGVRYLWRSSLLATLAALAFVFNAGVGAVSVLDVVFVTRALHLHSETVGLLLAANGLGALLGSTAISLLSRRLERSYHLVVGLGVLVNGVGLAVYALAPNLGVAAVALAVNGLAFAPALAAYITMVQLVTEDAVMGRVMSLIYTSVAAAMILSMTGGGVLTDLFGVRQVLAGSAVLVAVCGGLCLALVRATPAPRLTFREVPLPAVAVGETLPLESTA